MNIKNKILSILANIEKERKVKIIYACESGSRAWGFPSRNSDYDVRFIYAHPVDWYLAINEKRDVIELAIEEDLDVNGWDLKKALKLMKKSNSPLLEWISSPIKYYRDQVLFNQLILLSQKAFLPKPSCYHYLSMAKKQISNLSDNKVKLKSYFYCLRPILCCKWIIKYSNQPPMEIGDLLNEFISFGEIHQFIDSILKMKKLENESYEIDRFKKLDDYMSQSVEYIESNIPNNDKSIEIDEFNKVFRLILKTMNQSAGFGQIY